MKFIVDDEIFKTYSGVEIGYCYLQSVDNAGESEDIMRMLREQESLVEEKFQEIEINSFPAIAVWREAYRTFGAKPKKYPSSIENLIKRNLSGNRLPHINKLVDIYNFISLKYLLPVGGEDLSKIKGDIQLTFASDDEASVYLLGERDARPPYPREVIYKDSLGTICRRWNWKEVDRTKLTEETESAIVVIELLPHAGASDLKFVLDEFARLTEKFCNAKAKVGILTVDNSQVKLD